MFKHLIFLFLLIGSISLKAQTSFSSEPAVFIEEFKTFMSASKKSDILKATDNFIKVWKSGKVTEEQKLFIVQISNNMMYKQLPREPYFELLVSNLDLYYQKALNEKLLKQWQSISKTLLDKNPKEYLAFLETANGLFKDNTFNRSEARRWYASNNNFEFNYIKNRVVISFNALDLFCDANWIKLKS